MAIHSYADARKLARRRLPWMVFDYIDGAAGEGAGEAANLAALANIQLQPRALVDVSNRDLGVSLFGERTKLPFGIAPMGMCNLSGPGADKAFAKFAALHNVPLGVSTVSSSSLEQIIEWADGNAWFQLYYSARPGTTDRLIERAQVAGYKTLVLTVDVPEVGRRPRELRRGFKMPFRIGPTQFIDFALHPRWSIGTLMAGAPKMANFTEPGFEFDRTDSRAGADWDYLAKLRSQWTGNLVVKGVTSVEDATRLRDLGVDAIQVSSHGGRQLDSATPSITALARIRAALGSDFPLFYDSGLRSGEDVIKAYAMGASFVFFGRAMQFAYAAGRTSGLTQMTDNITNDASSALAQLGQVSMDDLTGCLA